MSSEDSENIKVTENDDNEFARAVFNQMGIKDEDFKEEYAKNQEFVKEMINHEKDKKNFGMKNKLKKGLKGIVSVAIDEVSSAIGLAAEMEKYNDEQLKRIIKTGTTKQRSAAAYVLKKRGY